ncbi:hypothetical protein NDU88_009483 [Pleurodeles waltl]|uniref:Uncharacterized protein n=1 Tax=Pleurodeles waltl TaxID=8319 RepID=A0AAV7QRP1_PLEWA|nr:hypothetical protein NDU88_009483 [Pleurodeles waltl]
MCVALRPAPRLRKAEGDSDKMLGIASPSGCADSRCTQVAGPNLPESWQARKCEPGSPQRRRGRPRPAITPGGARGIAPSSQQALMGRLEVLRSAS